MASAFAQASTHLAQVAKSKEELKREVEGHLLGEYEVEIKAKNSSEGIQANLHLSKRLSPRQSVSVDPGTEIRRAWNHIGRDMSSSFTLARATLAYRAQEANRPTVLKKSATSKATSVVVFRSRTSTLMNERATLQN